jgi:hypothetical protein
MKPRFSILMLLGITAYVAVFAAVAADPSGPWQYIAIILVLMLPLFAAGYKTGLHSWRHQSMKRRANQEKSGE